MYYILNAADYGVASNRKRLFIVAAAPGLYLPSRPEPTHRNPKAKFDDDQTAPSPVYVTVRDAIRDLEWRNPRVDAHSIKSKSFSTYCHIPEDGNHPEPSEYALSLGRQATGLVTHHITGRKAGKRWSRKRTLGDYDKPSTSKRDLLCPLAYYSR